MSTHGFDEFEAQLASLGKIPTDNVLGKVVLAGGLIIESEMKLNIQSMGAIDTGATLNSVATKIKQSDGKAVAIVGPSTEYAHNIEYGTKHMPARPFARKAIEQGSSKAIDIMGHVLSTEVARLLK